MENEMINYSKEYFTKEEHDFSHVFDMVNVNEDTKIQKMKNEINRLKREIENKEEELKESVSEFQKTNYSPISEKVILHYDGRNMNRSFDLFSGLPYNKNDDEEITEYKVSNKRGTVEVIVGYNFELGGIETKTYSYSINSNYDMVKIKLIKEKLISFFENKRIEYNYDNGLATQYESRKEDGYYWSDGNKIFDVVDRGFVNGFYGVDYKGKKTFGDLVGCFGKNKSFEIILKTAPSEIVDDLLNYKVGVAVPIYKIIGIAKDTYEKAIEKDLLIDVYKCRNCIGRIGSKTENDILDFIEYVKMQEDELEFYNIKVGGYYYGDDTSIRSGELAKKLLESYTENELFVKNYSLGKFADYVLTEVVNQGYTSVDNFINSLRDYLYMCDMDGIVPTLYSSYLKQTHDITSRNHAIKVEKESEEIFASRYDGFKTQKISGSEFKGYEYYVVAPKCTNDLKQEGDNLNHCVASYIKKVIDGKCLIYFLRTDEKESLITFEVVDNKIVQIRGLHNRKPTDKEYIALKKFAEKNKMEVKA
jgi:hypothetical protein